MGDGVSLLEQRESQEDPGWQKRRAVHLRVLTVGCLNTEKQLSLSVYSFLLQERHLHSLSNYSQEG